MIVENEKDSYFVNLINNIKWNMKFAWFEFLIKWEEYEWRIWELYMIIKKDISILIKEFHENHSSWFVLIEWIKKKQWLFSDTQNMNHENRKIKKRIQF